MNSMRFSGISWDFMGFFRFFSGIEWEFSGSETGIYLDLVEFNGI